MDRSLERYRTKSSSFFRALACALLRCPNHLWRSPSLPRYLLWRSPYRILISVAKERGGRRVVKEDAVVEEHEISVVEKYIIIQWRAREQRTRRGVVLRRRPSARRLREKNIPLRRQTTLLLRVWSGVDPKRSITTIPDPDFETTSVESL